MTMCLYMNIQITNYIAMFDFYRYNRMCLPVVELEVSGGDSLADTLGVTVEVPGCR